MTMHNKQFIEPSIRSGIPRPRLEITTPAVRTPAVAVELVPGGVSGDGREIRKSNC